MRLILVLISMILITGCSPYVKENIIKTEDVHVVVLKFSSGKHAYYTVHEVESGIEEKVHIGLIYCNQCIDLTGREILLKKNFYSYDGKIVSRIDVNSLKKVAFPNN